MKKTYLYPLLSVLLIIIIIILLHTNRLQRHEDSVCPVTGISPEEQSSNPTQQFSSSKAISYYPVKQFDLAGKLKGLSTSQINQHKTLYEGYVKKRNDIARDLKTVNRADQNRTYSPFRELKVEETYAVNGSILHELYFENIGKQGSVPGQQMSTLINQAFGSLEAFKKDLMECGQCSRGWVITAYSFDDHMLHNFVFEQHNQNVPVLIIPLLVLDVYEHAYMIDFGIKRDPYLTVFWNNIDWDVVEQRIDTWVNKLR